jgi:ribosome-associated translation inhibitor RaiA
VKKVSDVNISFQLSSHVLSHHFKNARPDITVNLKGVFINIFRQKFDFCTALSRARVKIERYQLTRQIQLGSQRTIFNLNICSHQFETWFKLKKN